MTQQDESHADHHPPEPDVYLGLDDLSAALGFGLGFFGVAELIVANSGSHDASVTQGAVMTLLGVGFLAFALVFKWVRPNASAH